MSIPPTPAPAAALADGVDEAAFAAMVWAAHGYSPFPWQRRLATQAAEGRWPAVIDVPTGLGKTLTLDAAVFALAAQAGQPLGRRRAPLRIWYVIDRRVVVDDVAEHAHRLATALANPADPRVAVIAQRLRTYGGQPSEQAPPSSIPPLRVVSLRGGQLSDPDWATRLDVPMVLVSTIDQFGSRLLFRGYGVPSRRWPLHAAFAGADSLIVLDEAHLARPLMDTLARLREVPAEQPVAPPPTVVAMSATVSAAGADILRLDQEDLADPVVAQRYRTRKLVRLHRVAKPPELVDRLAKLAVQATQDAGIRVVGVVANRVGVARAVRARLAKLDPAAEQRGDVLLLTARQRPIERAELVERVRARAGASRVRAPDTPVFYLVATQTIEVGVDLDLDALVTECCPLDSLIQRIGRLDRRGKLAFYRHLHHGVAPGSAAGVDVVFCDALDGGPPDGEHRPLDKVYGAVTQATWQWLTEQAASAEAGDTDAGELDLGPAGVDRIPPESRRMLAATTPQAPIVTTAHLDAWLRTSPAPALSPQVAPFLHGIGNDQAEVSLVWRADLTGPPTQWPDQVTAYPPRAHEQLPVPLWEARRWLAGRPADRPTDRAADADLDQVDQPTDPTDPRQPTRLPAWPQRPVVVVRDGVARLLSQADHPEPNQLSLDQLAPGDILVCPATTGGADRYGWNPTSTTPVPDVADHDPAHPAGPRLRLDPTVLPTSDPERLAAIIAQAVELVGSGDLARTETQAGLTTLLREVASVVAEPLNHTVQSLAAAGRRLEWALEPAGPERQRVVVTARTTRRGWAVPDADPDASSLTGVVTLAAHSNAVGDRASAYAGRLGLPTPVRSAVELGARHHDLGKAHPAMQCWLHGADPIATAEALRTGTLLAKSDTPYTHWRHTRRLAKLPDGFRHEAISAALLLAADLPGIDQQLAAHLAAAHHGHARPAFPPLLAPDPAPVAATINQQQVRVDGNPLQGRLDDRWIEAFFDLNTRYGPWGLALLEALVIAADITCSQEGT